MKKLALIAAAVLMSAPAMADITGVWQTAPGDTGGWLHVKVYDCAGAACGKIVKAFDKTGKNLPDYKNLGVVMLKDMKSADGVNYSGGTIWAPDRDKTYKSKIRLNGNTLSVKGCISFICRDGGTWKRVN